MASHSHLSLHDRHFRAAVRQRLLAWFEHYARTLPWRNRADPYAIWISEVMLQQTQVATVIPYFERFLTTFPSVAALAAADEQQVLRLWEGLGYYRRARALHSAARQLVAFHGGAVPNDPELLGRLPGLGRYTVNAVLSQAFDRRLPILEANSRRVLCRLLGEQQDPRAAATEKRLWDAATRLLPRRRVGAFNQALMELGAIVCTPSAPHCDACPVKTHCVAYRLGKQHDIPCKPPPVKIEEVAEVAVAVRRRGQVLLVQRPDTGRWPGMWELPRREVVATDGHEQAAQELLTELGLVADLGQELATVRHSVTRFRITLVCLEAVHRHGAFRRGLYPVGRWVALPQLADFPLSRPQRRLVDALRAQSTRLF